MLLWAAVNEIFFMLSVFLISHISSVAVKKQNKKNGRPTTPNTQEPLNATEHKQRQRAFKSLWLRSGMALNVGLFYPLRAGCVVLSDGWNIKIQLCSSTP